MSRPATYSSLWDRIIANIWVIEGEESDGCWHWLRRVNNDGYPQLTVWDKETKKNHKRYVHHLILEDASCLGLKRPKGLDVGHLCHNRSCVNPNHLEFMTRSQNILMIYQRASEREESEIDYGF